MLKNTPQDIEAFLEQQGQKDSDDIPLFETALAFSALRHPSRAIERYYHQIERMQKDVLNQLAQQGSDHGEARYEALKYVFVEKYGFTGNREHYDLIDNADICYVLDKAKGLPVALSILYLEICDRLKWFAAGVNFPGHFIIKLNTNGQQMLIDPFSDARKLGAIELRQLIKDVKGPDAELNQSYYNSANKREILIRLQNNIKKRQIAAEDYEAALETVRVTEYIAPNEYRLLLDKGVLLAKNTRSAEAIETLERFITLTPYAEDRADARMFIEQIHQELL